MGVLFELVQGMEMGNKKAFEIIMHLDWWKSLIDDEINNRWYCHGKAFRPVYDNMDREYLQMRLQYDMLYYYLETARRTNTTIEDIVGEDQTDVRVRKTLTKFVRNIGFSVVWSEVFYEAVQEAFGPVGSMATFKRRLNLYDWFLKNSVSHKDLNKSNKEIIKSLDLVAVVKRYQKSEDDQLEVGKIMKRLESDLNQVRLWIMPYSDISPDNVVYSTEDVLQSISDSESLAVIVKRLQLLPEKERFVFLESVVKGRTNQEIASDLGLTTEGATRYQCKKALKKLQRDLA